MGLSPKQGRFSCLPRVLQGCKTNQANNTKHLPPFVKGGRKLSVLFPHSTNIESTHPKPQKVGSEIVLQVERLAISGYAIPIDTLSVCIAGDT